MSLALWYVSNETRGIDIAERLGLTTVGLSFNFDWETSDGKTPLSDLRVRQAIAHATNKTEIIDLLQGGIHTEANNLFNSNYAGSKIGNDLYPMNLTKAQLLLTEAGYSEGLDLIFHGIRLPYYETIPILLKTQWEKSNIRLQIKLEELSAWTQRMFVRKDYSVGWLILGARSPEPLESFQIMFHSEGNLNFGNYSNPETDELIDQASITVNPTTRYTLYEKIQTNIMHDLPTYPLWWEMTFLIHQKKVKNIYVDPFHAHGDWMEEVYFVK